MDLPDSLLASTPRLIVLYSWALALACQLDAAEELGAQLARFLPAADAATQADLLAQWQALAGIIARGRGDIEGAERHCAEALAQLPMERSGPRLMCLSSLANLAIVRGDSWGARGLNREALELAQRFGNPLLEALVHYDRARGLQARGEVLRAGEELEQGLARLAGQPAHRRYAVRGRLLIYQGYLLVAGTRAFNVVRGILVFASVWGAAQLLGLTTLSTLLGRAGTIGLFALVVLFQPELRAALERVGRPRGREGTDGSAVLQTLARAMERLAERKTGALIAIERKTPLGEYAATGVTLDAVVSVPFADGSAYYVVVKLEGRVGLMVVDIGDGWRDDRFERTATVAELKRIVAQRKRMQEFFAKRQAEREATS